MILSKLDMLLLIGSLRETDPYIKDIFTMGGCYQFHLFLNKIAMGKTRPMINITKDHVVTEFMGSYFDITGIVKGYFEPLNNMELKMVQKWSFQKNNLLQLSECPNCDEPLIFEK